MKKSLLVIIALVFSMSQLYSQTATSVNDGNWLNPLTWDCMCVPTQTYDAIVNTDVILNTDFVITTGSITVNAGASLMQDATLRDLWVNGGDFTNNGKVDLKRILMSSGTFVNNDTLYVQTFANYLDMINSGKILSVDSLYNNGTLTNNTFIDVNTFYNDGTINNYGEFAFLDSLWNQGTFLNDVDAVITADSCTNAGTFTNNGQITYFDFTNAGVFTNNETLHLTHDFLNLGDFTNNKNITCDNSCTNAGYFLNDINGDITIYNSFLNADTINNDALFDIEGTMFIYQNFWNFDTIKGDCVGGSYGWIGVQDSTYNSGYLLGCFDICDWTRVENALDLNIGVTESSVQFCILSVNDLEENKEITIFPNPAENIINIEPFENYNIEIYNCLGKLILQSNKSQIDISKLKKGFYFLNISDVENNLIKTAKIIKL